LRRNHNFNLDNDYWISGIVSGELLHFVSLKQKNQIYSVLWNIIPEFIVAFAEGWILFPFNYNTIIVK